MSISQCPTFKLLFFDMRFYVQALFHTGQTLFLFSQTIFSSRPFYAEWGCFSNRKAPFPLILGQTTMSLYYKPCSQSGPTFQKKGAPFHSVNFCFIDDPHCMIWTCVAGAELAPSIGIEPIHIIRLTHVSTT